jgi:hypothetical protein
MKKLIGIVCVLVLVFAGCDMPTGGDEGEGDTITIDSLSVKDTGVKSLYVSNISANTGAKALGDTQVIQTLAYINSLGQNTPFFFVSPSGKNIVLGVSELQQLDEKRIFVTYNSVYEIIANGNVYTINAINSSGYYSYYSYYAIIDMEKGKAYKFMSSTTGSGSPIVFAGNGLLFTEEYPSGTTLYKTDLNNIPAGSIPLNNSAYNPIYGSTVVPMLFGNKILVRESYSAGYSSYDINNKFPPKPVTNAVLTSDMCSFGSGQSISPYGTGIDNFTIQDLSGSPYCFIVNSKDNTGKKYFLGKISIDDDGQALIGDYKEGSLAFSTDSGAYYASYTSIRDKNSTLFLFSGKGFIRLKKKAAGMEVESVVLSSIPDFSNSKKYEFIKDDYLYYLEGSSIKRLYLSAGSSPETLYANGRLLTGGASGVDFLTATGNNLVFYQYANDNITVNTYSLAMYQPGAQPVLLSASSVDIKNIVELDF